MPTRPTARKRGRPQHVPDEKGRRRVIAWSGGGIDQEMIALSLNISRLTLRKHYAAQLAIGKTVMDCLAISTLVKAMQSGGREAVTAAKWWTACRMGWTLRLTQDDGKLSAVPMRVIIELVDGPTHVAAESTDQPKDCL